MTKTQDINIYLRVQSEFVCLGRTDERVREKKYNNLTLGSHSTFRKQMCE